MRTTSSTPLLIVVAATTAVAAATTAVAAATTAVAAVMKSSVSAGS
jgi:hypothetical protein